MLRCLLVWHAEGSAGHAGHPATTHGGIPGQADDRGAAVRDAGSYQYVYVLKQLFAFKSMRDFKDISADLANKQVSDVPAGCQRQRSGS